MQQHHLTEVARLAVVSETVARARRRLIALGVDLAAQERVALLCFEADDARCHRQGDSVRSGQPRSYRSG